MSTFSVFRLPTVAIRDIVSLWNPYELYNLSCVSKKTKEQIKFLMKKRKPKIYLKPGTSSHILELAFSENWKARWGFKVIDKSKPSNEEESDIRILPLFTENPKIKTPELIRHLADFFSASIEDIHLDGSKTDSLGVQWVVEFLNNWSAIKTVPAINFIEASKKILEVFMNTYKKNVDGLFIITNREVGELSIQFPQHFDMETVQIVAHKKWIGLEMLLNFKSKNIMLGRNYLTVEDFNLFIMSWQAEKSNLGMECFTAHFNKKIDLRLVLRCLQPSFEDPRTSKRRYRDHSRDQWIHGGIDIKRNDGKVATILLLAFESRKEEDNVPQNIINLYENAMRSWDEGAEVVEVERIVHFKMIVW